MTKTTCSKSDPRVAEAINHAIDLNSKGHIELAVQHLSALIAEFPTVASIRGYIALFLFNSGRFGEAIEHGRKAVLLAPKSERSEEHTSELQSRGHLVCRLLLEKK